MTFKCPKCGHRLKRNKRGRYECTNPKCPIIELRINYDPFKGYRFIATKTDSVMISEEMKGDDS